MHGQEELLFGGSFFDGHHVQFLHQMPSWHKEDFYMYINSLFSLRI